MANTKKNIVFFCTIIATIITIFTYLGLKPKRKEVNKDQNGRKNINVVSYNQQGGITAGEVNVGFLPRTFTQEHANELDSLLVKGKADKNKTIIIWSTIGDSGSYNFAEQIKKYLELKGWHVEGINQAFWQKPIKGVEVSPKQDGNIDIKIGSK